MHFCSIHPPEINCKIPKIIKLWSDPTQLVPFQGSEHIGAAVSVLIPNIKNVNVVRADVHDQLIPALVECQMGGKKTAAAAAAKVVVS